MVEKVVNADEKIDIEVATMDLLRQRTTIPILEVKAWGMAAEDALGIGPFIMMDFVEVISLNDILQTPDARIMRQDIIERAIEVILLQMIDVSLQLQKLDFPHIGSLFPKSTAGKGGFAITIYSRPVTKKSHDLLLKGRANVLGGQRHLHSSISGYTSG